MSDRESKTGTETAVHGVVLLPCPFCGEQARVEVDGNKFKIGCNMGNCIASVIDTQTTYPVEIMPARVRQWNYRPSLTVSVAVEGNDGPAQVFDELRLAMAYARAVDKPSKIWWKSGSAISGQ